MRSPEPVRRRRLWPLVAPVVLTVVLAVGWTGFWFYAASAAQKTLAGWRERESRVGRIHTCESETIGGYPFRIEFHCVHPSVALQRETPPVVLKAADLLVVAQIYQPTLLISEFSGPMTVTPQGESTSYVANWTLGHASVRGTPFAPERVSLVFEGPTLDRAGGSADTTTNLFKANRLEVHGRIAESSDPRNPAVDIVLRLASAAAPELHALTTQPLNAEVVATLHGLPDLAPRPWPDRFKMMQARGGKIDITRARVEQGDVTAVSAGVLSLTPRGTLDGQMDVTIVGIEQVLKALDVDRMVSQGDIGDALGKLDRIMPGLGQFARQNAAPTIVAGLGAIGRSTTLDGKPAVTVPLRFVDGEIRLGPLTIGHAPPLF
jgi:hypothetical protein